MGKTYSPNTPQKSIPAGARVRFRTVGRGGAWMEREGVLSEAIEAGSTKRQAIAARDGDKERLFRPYPQHVTAL